MKYNKYKIIASLFATFFISSLQAQKFDKKYSENFKVNKDVNLVINASNAEINVTTWSKNQVEVKAVISVEGLTKAEAEKYLKNTNFEALGNKSKVQINAGENGFYNVGNNMVLFSNKSVNFPNIEMPEMPEIPEIPEMPEFEMPEMPELPEFNFDLYNKNGKDYFFQFKDSVKHITIKSKEEWEKFKKTDEYKKIKEELDKNREKMQKQFEAMRKNFSKANVAKIKAQYAKAKLQYKQIDKKKIKLEIEKARIAERKAFNSFTTTAKKNGNVIFLQDLKNRKNVKIKKNITIKVPKNATFQLNTRHSKVTLPKGKVSGKVSYGTFNSDAINGGNLKINFSPIHVGALNASTISLNNTTDANFASVVNTKLTSNSSKLAIGKLDKNVHLTAQFGDVLISNVSPTLSNFVLLLNYSNAKINLTNFKAKLINNIGNKSSNFHQNNFLSNTKNGKKLTGNFTVKTADNTVKITSKLSELTIKKD